MARIWVSTLRRPITSPPGGGSLRSPVRATMGPANKIDARIRRHKSGWRSAGHKSFAWNLQVWLSNFSAITPRLFINEIISCTSRISGTLCKVTGSEVRRQAASRGNAAFLFPEGVTSPFRGYPPWIINLSIEFSLPCDCYAKSIDCQTKNATIVTNYCYNSLYDNIHHRDHPWLAFGYHGQLCDRCPTTPPTINQAFLHSM